MTQQNHHQLAIGTEFSFDSMKTGATYTFFTEYQTLFGNGTTRSTDLALYQHDVFLGTELLFNTRLDHRLFTGAIIDVDSFKEGFCFLSYSQRLSDIWKFESSLSIYESNTNNRQISLDKLKNNDTIQISLTRYY